MSEAARAALGFAELRRELERRLRDGEEAHLRHTVAGVDGKAFSSSVDEGDFDLAAVIGVDDAHAVGQRDAEFRSEPAARENQGDRGGGFQLDRKPGRHEGPLSRLKCDRLGDRCPQVAARRPRRLVNRDFGEIVQFADFYAEGFHG